MSDEADKPTENPAVPLRTILVEAFLRMKRREAGIEKRVRCPWHGVDEMLGGGLTTGAHMLVGGTKSGKTQFALQWGFDAAVAGTPVLYIGLELEPVGIVARLAAIAYSYMYDDDRMREELTRLWREHFPAARSNHPPPYVRWSRMFWNPSQDIGFVAYVEAVTTSWLAELPIRIELVPARGWPASRMLEAARLLRSEHPLKVDEDKKPMLGTVPMLVILDFLQIVGEDTAVADTMDIRTRIAHASYVANEASRSLDATVLILSGTARANYGLLVWDPPPYDRVRGETPKKKRPPLYELVGLGKESGEIEYSATTVMVIGCESSTEDQGVSDTRWVGLAANRAGPTGWEPLGFKGGFFRAPSVDQRKMWKDAYKRKPDAE